MAETKAPARRPRRAALLPLALLAWVFFTVLPFLATAAPTVESLQAQIDELQRQLDLLKAAASQAQQPPPAAREKTSAPPGQGRSSFATTAVKLTFGGFIEAAGIYRNPYNGADVNSKFNLGAGGIPLPVSPNYYMTEFRGTARHSRLSLLAEGQDKLAALAAYFEIDFLGGANSSSATSSESNGYFPRLRHAYATYEGKDKGWHILAGQSWSMITMNKAGITPRQENIPLTIDSQYVPGFTWLRVPQVRLVKNFDDKVWLGLSLESPQALITAGQLPAAPAGSSYSNTLLTGDNNLVYTSTSSASSNLPSVLSLDNAPDVIGKIALDSPFGHYEAYGLARFFTDRTLINGSRSNNTSVGGGGGAAALIPIIAKRMEFQASFLAGRGVGRYGSAQFNDAVVNPLSGKLDPISEIEVLIGLIGHPGERLDLYAYGGMERVSRRDVVGTRGGFGNPAFVTPACLMEGGVCLNAQASSIVQSTVGGWYTFYKGSYGLMKIGLQYSYSTLKIFALPSEDQQTGMVSFRYYPF